MNSRLFRVVVVGIVGLCAGAPGRVAAAQEDVDLPPLSSYEQLLGVLMSPRERQAWDRLRNDPARQVFVDKFWLDRDPTPGTAVNELRIIFQRRARRAATSFGEGSAAGYATDRGRVLLVYGLPRVQELRALPPGTDSPELLWVYGDGESQSVRFSGDGQRFSLASALEFGSVPFYRSAQEELRLLLSTGVGASSRAIATAPPAMSPAAAEGDGGAPPGSGATGAADVVVAPEVRIWMQMMFSGATFDDIGFRHRIAFFPAVESTYTVVAFQVDKDDLEFAATPSLQGDLLMDGEVDAVAADVAPDAPGAAADAAPVPPETARLKLFGAFLQGESGHEDTIHQFIIPFQVADDDNDELETGLRSVGTALLPGTYRLAWGLYDERSGKAVTRDVVITVPDFSAPGLQLSDTIIARPPNGSYSKAMTTDQVYEGMRLGSVQLHDDLDRVVGRDEVIESVVMVSGWQADPAAPGKPRLEVEYRILDDGTSIVRLPAQVLDFHILGQQIPLGQVDLLVPGRAYALEVRVKDLVADTEVVATTPIRIRDTATSR